MKQERTIATFRDKKWYQILKVLNILFVVFCFAVAIMGCAVLYTTGIGIALKIILTAVILFVFWIVSQTPQKFFYFLWEVQEVDNWYSKVILITGSLLALLIGIAIVTLVLPLNNGEKQFVITDTSPVGSPQFIQTLSDLTGAPAATGDAVVPIDDSSQFLPMLLASINGAQSSVNFTTFPWADGTFSDQVFAALTSAAKRGVQVRLLLDALGSGTLSKDKITTLEAAGGIVTKYHPFKLLSPLQYDNRDHMRAIVIDGKIGFTGGVGITGDWLGKGPSELYQDMMFEFTGAMAQSIQNTFDENWNNVTGRVLAGPTFYPPVPPPAAPNTFIGITSIPSEDYQPVRDAFMLTVLSAKKSLYIVNPYIVPDKNLLAAIEQKAREGVDVEIVSPGPITDAPTLRSAWHVDYESLLAAGVKVYEYQPSMIHTKFIVADGAWSLIGSANIDNRSELLNNENVMGIADPSLAGSLDTVFAGYVAQSHEFTLADWQKQYGFFQKIYSDILLLLCKQY